MLTLRQKSLNLAFDVCSFWLRDHCQCSECYSEMKQRKFNITDIPLDIEPTELKTEDNNVSVTCKWQSSEFDIKDLTNVFQSVLLRVGWSQIQLQHFGSLRPIAPVRFGLREAVSMVSR